MDTTTPPPRFAVPARWLPAWSVVAAFGTYFCMYGFRKPFTAASFENLRYLGTGYKTLLVTAQVFGYMAAKIVGVKLISECKPEHRAPGLLVFLLGAELALGLFAITPPPYNALWLFLNGMNLGMIFGLVIGFLEGRRNTEALTAGLCASFILADGITKSIGAYLLQAGVGTMQMPFMAGLFFIPPLFLFVWMLARIPIPNDEDRKARSLRGAMNAEDRRRFLRKYASGLVPLLLCFLFVTIMRSIRADFAPELWKDLGTTGQPAVFTRSEFYVTLCVMLASGLSIYIPNNRTAFFVSLANSVVGSLVVVASALAWQAGLLSGFSLMVMLGLGLYLPYVAVHTTVFERLLAMTRDKGNIGFLMYLADSFGYLGYVAVMLARNYFGPPEHLLGFYLTTCLALGSASVICLLVAIVNFRRI